MSSEYLRWAFILSLLIVANSRPTDAENNRSQEITRAAAPGETVLLPCRLPNMTPVWLYHDHRDQHNVTHNGFVTLKFYGRFQLDSDGLLINDVHIEDQGTYTCVDHHHHHQRQIRLFVPCERKYIHKGQSITLNCQAVLHNSIIWSFIPPHDNNDIRIVYWQNQIYNVDRQRFKILRPEEGIFDLVVNRVNASDAGIYRCRESDGRYPGESCTQLVIEKFNTSFVGGTVHLQCGDSEASNVISPVDWIYQSSLGTTAHRIISAGHLTNGNRGGRLNVNGSTLTISNVEINDKGRYICVEAAGLGTKHYVSLDVQLFYSASKSVARRTVTAVFGGSVTLPCRATLATPVDWYFIPSTNARGRFLYSAGNIVNGHDIRFALDRNVPGDFSLIIANVTSNDAGVYICTENAGLGLEHRVNLYVRVEQENRVQTSKARNVATASIAALAVCAIMIVTLVISVIVLVKYYRHYAPHRFVRGQSLSDYFLNRLEVVGRAELAKHAEGYDGFISSKSYKSSENTLKSYRSAQNN